MSNLSDQPTGTSDRRPLEVETTAAGARPRPGRTRRLYRQALWDSFVKLDPRQMVRNPVMLVVEAVSVLTTVLWIRALAGRAEAPAAFIFWISVWLWITVLFANFAEALAEGRGKAQAEALRRTRQETPAKRLRRDFAPAEGKSPDAAGWATVSSTELRRGDRFLAEAGDVIPADGEVEIGVASVDESAVTGESAPVIRESGGDRSAVTGGTRVLSDWLVVRVTAEPGEGFLDRMIALVEGAKRKKTPNEIALSILLAGFTLVFLLVCASLLPFSLYGVQAAGRGEPVSITVLVALLVCLIPTTIGGLLSAIGIAGMDRLIRRNVIALSGRAVEAAGDVDVLLLDKTGTITLGNRQAVELIPVDGVTPVELAELAQLASLADETPEGRSIVVLGKEKFGLRGRPLHQPDGRQVRFVPFSAQTRMSGVDVDGLSIRKGAPDAIRALIQDGGGSLPPDLDAAVDRIARAGGTPLVVARNGRAVGVIHLKDIVKGGIRERFAQLRRMGIQTVMITGDNPLTAAAIAAEAGVDDFLAQATPEAKLALIRRHQARGPPGGDDRRRDQRRPGAGPGRRGRGHEHRDPAGARGGQHDRPGQQSHQAHRDRGNRQADAHDPRGAHHVQHRQRRGQVLRHHSGGVRLHLPGAADPQCAGAVAPHPLGRDLQRPDHRRA